jgi:hypothetical protein
LASLGRSIATTMSSTPRLAGTITRPIEPGRRAVKISTVAKTAIPKRIPSAPPRDNEDRTARIMTAAAAKATSARGLVRGFSGSAAAWRQSPRPRPRASRPGIKTYPAKWFLFTNGPNGDTVGTAMWP